MKVLVILAVVGAALAAPQGEEDAEFIPGGGGRRRPIFFGRDPTVRDDNDGGVIVVTPSDGISLIDLIRRILGGSRIPVAEEEDSPPRSGGFPFGFPDFFNPRTPGSDGQDGEEPPSSGGFPFGFPDIFGSFPFGPSPGDLPSDYDNSTSVVKDVNGTKLEVNSTVTKQTGEDGNVFIRHFHIVRTLPGESTDEVPPAGDVEGALDVPQEDASQNEVFGENFKETLLSRHRRWNEWFQKASAYVPMPFRYRPYRFAPRHPNSLPEHSIEKEQPGTRRPINLIPIRNNNDIAVNYLSPVPRPANPDAEVFDVDLLREDEERFFEGRDQPESAQPTASQPLRSQPIRSQPIRSQPIMSQPIMSQPIRSQPLRSQPLRSQPLRSQPLRSQPLRSQPLRSQPLRSQPLRSQPLRSQPLRSQPLRENPRL